MDGILNYIFDRMRSTNVSLRKINETLKIQSTLICIFAGVTLVTVAHVKQQQDKIEKLTEEVEELKKEKGE